METSIIFFLISTTLFFGSAYINHRTVGNSEGLLSLFAWCAIFTTASELGLLYILKGNDLTVQAVFHIGIWLVWFAGMKTDNRIQKFFDNRTTEKKESIHA